MEVVVMDRREEEEGRGAEEDLHARRERGC